MITDENGLPESLFVYYPYGSDHIIQESAAFDEDHKFTGQEHDEETGLYYYGARYYDPVIGRFAQVDPWAGDLGDPQSLNKYAYVRNNPLRYVDPSGEILKLSDANSEEFNAQAMSDLRQISEYVTVSSDGTIGLQSVIHDGSFNSAGYSLLASLIADENTTEISQLTENPGAGGRTQVAAHEKGGWLKSVMNAIKLSNGTGLDSSVAYAPDSNAQVTVYDQETGETSREKSPSYITLAHELIHSLHNVQGTKVKEHVTDYLTLNGALDFANYEEVRTVGLLREGGDNEVTENDIRKENGEKLRNQY